MYTGSIPVLASTYVARVAELVDAADLKSAGHCGRAGSIPASGTMLLQGATSCERSRLGRDLLNMPADTQALVQAKQIWLRRGGRELYGGIDLELRPGSHLWLRAPNGQGKTTLLRIVAGFITPEQGSLRWRGEKFTQRHEEDQQAISYLDERLGLSLDLSVQQNLSFNSKLLGHEDVEALLQRCQLTKLAHRPVRQLSTGQKKRCAMARLLAESAQVWLLDEPANGLDTDNRALLCELIEQHVEKGGACLFTSHDALPFQDNIPTEFSLTQP